VQVDRRSFLRYCIQSAAGIGLSAGVIGKLELAFAQSGGSLPTVLWLAGANCTGCTVSLANRIHADAPVDIADLLIHHINLAYHPNLMGASGDLAVNILKSASTAPYILAVEGGIPTAFGGHACVLWTDGGREVTAMEAISALAPKALATLCIGTCSSFGGIPAGNPNPAGIVSVSALTGIPTINISGCPTHPDWIVWTIAQLLAGNTPGVGEDGRPLDLFYGDGNNVHKNCPRKDKTKTLYFGIDNTCLKGLGCKGPQTQADCPGRKWNNGTNWCIGAGSQCIACTEAGFPDKFSPIYYLPEFLASSPLSVQKAEWRAAEQKLQVEGKGSVLAEVKVKDDGTGTLLGTATVDRFAAWKLDVGTLVNPPAKVRVESNGAVVVSAVTGSGATAGLRITKAEWRTDTLELRVEGQASPNRIVTLKDAYAGTVLASITAAGDGKWVFRIKNPAPVPTRVRVESDGATAEMNVANAPIVVGIALAEYRYDTAQLQVAGAGSAGHVVTVADAGTGMVLGSQTIASDGAWTVTAASPSPIPSRVRATCEGVIAEKDVVLIGSPAVRLTILKAEYDAQRRLKVEGGGPANKPVTIKDAATLTTYGSVQIDAAGKWKFVKSNPNPVPKQVRAECSGQVAEKDVSQRVRSKVTR
jgi:hydrogenase small subunit